MLRTNNNTEVPQWYEVSGKTLELLNRFGDILNPDQAKRLSFSLGNIEVFDYNSTLAKWKKINWEFILVEIEKLLNGNEDSEFYLWLFKDFFTQNADNIDNFLRLINLVWLINYLTKVWQIDIFKRIMQANSITDFYDIMAELDEKLVQHFKESIKNYHKKDDKNYPNWDLEELKRLFVNEFYYFTINSRNNFEAISKQLVNYKNSVTAKLAEIISLLPIYSHPDYYVIWSKTK